MWTREEILALLQLLAMLLIAAIAAAWSLITRPSKLLFSRKTVTALRTDLTSLKSTSAVTVLGLEIRWRTPMECTVELRRNTCHRDRDELPPIRSVSA